MEGSEHGSDAILRATQLVQYEDDEENDDKANSHSGQLRSVSNTPGGVGGDVGMHDTTRVDALDSNAHPGDQAGTEEAQDAARAERGYQDDDIDGRARGDVFIETSFREEVVVQHTTHTGEGAELTSEAMRVFCSYDTTTVVGHNEGTPVGVASGNDYSEEDVQERGLEEAALEERVHGDDQSPGYLPEEAARGEEHSSFSSLQQLELRAQILVYGDLIKGVLPEQALMSAAFSDEPPNEGTEQEPDRSPGGWNWEGPWQLALEKEKEAEAERREAERLAEEERINNKGDVIMTEGEAANAGADNLEPGTPSTSPIRVAEDPAREEGIPAAMPEAAAGGGGTPVHVAGPGPDDQPAADVNGVPPALAVSLDAVVDNIVATAVTSIDSSVLKDSETVPEVTRSPSLDPWLKPSPSQAPPATAPSFVAWQTPAVAANDGLASQAATVSTTSVIATAVATVAGVEAAAEAPPAVVTGNAEVPEDGSRKRKSRARERKTPAAPKTIASTPRRSRAKTASAAQTATPATVAAGVIPSRLEYESTEAAVVVQGAPSSPASVVEAGKTREAQGRSNLHADTQSWLEQAKASFEEAASVANSVAEQEQLVKSVTATPKSGKEAQLASAAAAVNAAASVAKAAAEAAKVAYEAALQATMMVSDGIDAAGLGKSGIGNGQGDKDGVLGGRRSNIAAAKEEARKRATASSTPSLKTTPQTTDAVLRAARLMAEAASEAGAVLAKGNSGTPLSVPLSPVSQLDLKRSGGRNNRSKENLSFKSPEPVKTVETDPVKSVKGSMKKGARRRGKELQELAASNSSARKGSYGQAKPSPEKATRRQLDEVMASASTATEATEVLEQSQIVDGSLVEVMNDEEGLRGGWFSAKVLQLRTGEAYVQYDEILTDDGVSQLKEWFPLEGPSDSTEPGRPRIRVISPNNIAREEGRRKRRRTTTGQKVWGLGDRVDAFVQDGWWEGVVRVVDEDDESKVTVNFPGEGDTSVVKSWNLRPSFVWKGGRWEQWIREATGQTSLDDGHQSKKKKVSESPKVQARKSGRAKSNPAGKVSDEATENSRASRRSRAAAGDSQSGGNPLSSPIITTRSSPRQKLPPKRKEGPIEVSTPTQAPTPVSTRTRSIEQEAVTEPLKRSAPSRTKSPLSSVVEKSENQLQELGPSSRALRNSEPSEEKKTSGTRQKATDVAKPATRRSARL